MPEKRLDVVVAAKALGIEATDAQLKKLGKTLRETQGGGFLKGLSKQAQGLGLSGDSSVFGLLKGTGALAGVMALGSMAGGAAEGVREYRDIIKFGGSKTEAFASVVAETIPLIGETAKKFRELWDELDGSARRLRDEEQGREDARAGIRTGQRRDTRRGKDLFDLGEDLRKARGSDAVVNLLDPFRQQRKQIENEFNEAKLERDRRRKRVVGNLAPDDQDAANKRFDLLDQAAERERARRISDSLIAAKQAGRQQEEEIRELEDQRRQRRLKRREFDVGLFGERADILGDIPHRDQEAARARIRAEFEKRDVDLERQTTDPNSPLSGAQRRLLVQMREMLPALQREALSNAIIDNPAAGRPGLTSSRFLTGAGNPQETRRIEKNTEEAAKWAKLLYDFIRSRPGGGGGSIFND